MRWAFRMYADRTLPSSVTRKAVVIFLVISFWTSVFSSLHSVPPFGVWEDATMVDTDYAPPATLVSRVVSSIQSTNVSKSCLDNQTNVEKYCSEFKCKNSFRPEPTKESPAVIKKTKPCKTLWFSGFHEGSASFCTNENGGGYRMDYATSLASARINAEDTLQPVLLLGRRDLKPNEHVGKLREWAKARGAIVIEVDHLSFEDDIDQWYSGKNDTENLFSNPGIMQGPFLRLDIPHIVTKHNLFDIPGVCPQYALWTDADVVFPSRISHDDMDELKSWMHRRRLDDAPYLMYGRESRARDNEPINTGVVLYDVARFRTVLPRLIRYRNEHKEPTKFITFDQGWLNLYFHDHETEKRQLLPNEWNWKLYWELLPRKFNDIKILHFHGLKPDRGLWLASECELQFASLGISIHYHYLMNLTICCDHMASTTTRAREFYATIQPSADEVC